MRDARSVRMAEITAEVEKLARHDNLTNAQEDKYHELRAEYRELDREQQLGELRERIAAGTVRLEPGAPTDAEYRNDPILDPGGSIAPSSTARSAALRAIDRGHRSGELPDYAAERATTLIETDPPTNRGLAARWAAAAGSEHYRSAFVKLLADPARGHMLFDEREHAAYKAVAAVQGEMRAMGISPDASGGFMVPLTLDPAILLTNAGTINPLRRVSRVVQTVTDNWNGVSSAGVVANWYAEHAEVTDDSPTLAQPSIPVHRGSAFIPYSFEFGMDAPNALTELQKLLLDGADRLMSTAYTTGTGTGQPTGIITALAGTASVIAPTTAETFAAADIYRLIEALPPRWQPQARWQAALGIINRVDQFESTNGAKKFDLSGGTLLRKPLDENSEMDSTWDPAVTANNYVLLVGEFQQFVIVDRIGAVLEVVPHLMGAAGRPTGDRGAFLWFRTGSNVTTINAFRLLNIATTL